jgi:hypothetical protein
MNQTIEYYEKQVLTSGVTIFKFELHNYKVTATVTYDELLPEFYNVGVVIVWPNYSKGKRLPWGLKHMVKAETFDRNIGDFLYIIAETTIWNYKQALKK